MKRYTLLLSTIISTVSFAMEQKIEIRNRSLDTLTQPHITIINRLPKDATFSARVDISDKRKRTNYNKSSYQPDDSTESIYSHQGIRFSPRLNKTGEPESKRLGMNDAGDAALIALYIHGAIKYPLIHLAIGKGAKVQFGETITVNANSHGAITLNHHDIQLWQLETQQSTDSAHTNVNNHAKDLLAQFSRPRTTPTPNRQVDICCSVPLVGKEYEDISKLGPKCWLEMKK
jgi:hypothetical protein